MHNKPHIRLRGNYQDIESWPSIKKKKKNYEETVIGKGNEPSPGHELEQQPGMVFDSVGTNVDETTISIDDDDYTDITVPIVYILYILFFIAYI